MRRTRLRSQKDRIMKEKLKKELDSQRGHNKGISQEAYDYIEKHFRNVERNDCSARRWHKVHCVNHDSKYGAFMICLETEQWRDVTMDEFYGSVVD